MAHVMIRVTADEPELKGGPGESEEGACLALTRVGLVPVRTGPRVFLENPSGLPLDSEVTG